MPWRGSRSIIEPFRIIRTAPQHLGAIPFQIARHEVRKVMGPGLAELKAALAAQGVAALGPWFTHHLRPPGEIFDFEICLPVAAPIASLGRVQAAQWPAMRMARTAYHGGFEGLGPAWGEFLAQLAGAGHKTRDDLYEVYAIGPETSADPAMWRTELSKPLVET